jgi:hypothetical protein
MNMRFENVISIVSPEFPCPRNSPPGFVIEFAHLGHTSLGFLCVSV